MRHRRIAIAFGLSLAIHLACLALLQLALRRKASEPRASQKELPTKVVLLTLPPPPAPPPPPSSGVTSEAPAKRRPKVKRRPVASAQTPTAPSPPVAVAPPPSPPPAAADAPTADAPSPSDERAPVADSALGRLLTSPDGTRPTHLHSELLPSIPGTGSFGTVSGDPHQRGHTLHNDPSELPDPEAVAAVDAQRMEAELEGFITDQLAGIRVENGAVDSYFSGMRTSLEKAASNPPLENDKFVQRLAQSWFAAAGQYARTGSPFEPGTQPEAGAMGEVPTEVEQQIADRPGSSNLESFQQKMTTGARLREFADGRNGGWLLAIVEIRQSPEGHYQGSMMVHGSGNPIFDAHVLNSAPTALELLPPPEPNAAGIHPEGIRSTWAFHGKIVYKKKVSDIDLKKDWWYLAAMAPVSLLTGNFDETTGLVEIVDLHDPRFECKVKLLKVY
jgi:hypothetical protein